MASILVVEDDPASARYLALVLREEGHEVRCVENGCLGLLAAEERLPDLVVTDLRMPEMNGLELLAHLQERWKALPVILASVEEDIEQAVLAVRGGAMNYLLKPCAPERIRGAMAQALAGRPALPETGCGGLEEIVGRSRCMVEVRHAVVLASRSDAPVLITGRTGTGKEVVARMIHRLSSRSSGPFVIHNCALTPKDLFDSVLFGHRRGAFTGADRDQRGLLAQADGGVFFLDELEAMDLALQAKLLRVLDDGEIRPLGSTEVQHVSVRFLAATNQDPLSLIRGGALREDLYWRLKGLEIHLPPLVNRTEDIPLLASHFLGSSHPGLTAGALSALLGHSWPGNVRELKHAVQNAACRAPVRLIEPRDLELQPVEWEDVPRPETKRAGSLKQAEYELIRSALEVCHGNKSQAAERLGIDRSTLRRKLAEMEQSS